MGVDDALVDRVRERMAGAGAPAPAPQGGPVTMMIGPSADMPGLRGGTITIPGLTLPEPQFPAAGADRPPCDPADVADAEAAIGVELPELLVRLYTEVADGGFGPGDGAVPIGQLAEMWESLTVDMVECEELDPWPTGVVPFCQVDQTLTACVDCSSPTGAVVGFEFDDLDPDAGEGALAVALHPMAASLGAWLEDWLREPA